MDYREQLLDLLHRGDASELSRFLEDSYHINIAEMLEDLDDEDFFRMIRLLSSLDMALLVEQCEPDQQRRFVDHLDTFALVEVFSFMSTDDVADVLGSMPTKRRKDLLQYLRYSDRQNIQMILSYDEDTAGGIMTTEFISLKSSLSCKEAIEKIREIATDIEVIDFVFITDPHHRLIGVAELREILASDDTLPLSQCMNDKVISIHPEADREDASRLVTRYDLTALPVVNRNNQILGIITVDDIIDVINEEHEEDVLAMSGVSRSEQVTTRVWESIRYRLPFLCVDLLYCFVLFGILLLFQDTFRNIAFLAALAPIVAHMTMDTSSQTLSVVITNLAQENLDRKDVPLFFLREIFIGFFHGILLGGLTGLLLFVLYKNTAISLLVWAATTLSFVLSHGVATLIPLVIKKTDGELNTTSFLVSSFSELLGFVVLLLALHIFLPLFG